MNGLFKIAVFLSILIIIYYTVGNQITLFLDKAKYIINENYKKSSIDDNKNTNKVLILGKMIFPRDILKEEKSDIQIVNNVKLAEVKNNIQEVIIEANPQQQGAEVIIAAKGVRANWIFRFKDGKVCNGNISIEKFGLNIPIVEKEIKMTFAPMKDFTVLCDKGYFKYYIKVVDNFHQVFGSTADQSMSITASAAVSTTTANSNMADANINNKPKEDASIPKEDKSKPSEQTKPIEPSIPENKTSRPQDAKKMGILDHILHHNH